LGGRLELQAKAFSVKSDGCTRGGLAIGLEHLSGKRPSLL
jgi:hypothetical protein